MKVANHEFEAWLCKLGASDRARKRFVATAVARIHTRRPELQLHVSRRRPKKTVVSVRWLSTFEASSPSARFAFTGAIAISGGRLKLRGQ